MGFWGCCVTAISLFFGLGMMQEQSPPSKMKNVVDLAPVFSEPITLVAPVVLNTKVAGYIFSEIVVEMNGAANARSPVPVDLLLRDGYLAYLIGNSSFLFPDVARFNVRRFKKGLKQKINAAGKDDLVRSVYVSNVNFLTPQESRTKQRLRSIWLQERTKAVEPVAKPKSKDLH